MLVASNVWFFFFAHVEDRIRVGVHGVLKVCVSVCMCVSGAQCEIGARGGEEQDPLHGTADSGHRAPRAGAVRRQGLVAAERPQRGRVP